MLLAGRRIIVTGGASASGPPPPSPTCARARAWPCSTSTTRAGSAWPRRPGPQRATSPVTWPTARRCWARSTAPSPGSAASLRGQRGGAHYTAAKAAVLAWTRTAAQEWARYGITVNAILPAMWTPMYEAYRARLSPEELAMHDLGLQHAIPLGGRLGDPARDLAPLMVFLAGDGARFITGQAFCVDGGMVMLG